MRTDGQRCREIIKLIFKGKFCRFPKSELKALFAPCSAFRLFFQAFCGKKKLGMIIRQRKQADLFPVNGIDQPFLLRKAFFILLFRKDIRIIIKNRDVEIFSKTFENI